MSDLIDRQAAIDAVYKCADIFAGDMPVMVVKSDAYEALAQLPPAQPVGTPLHDPTIELQRKKGKWIYGESEAGNDGYYCSKCGNFVPWKYDEYDIDFIKEFLFCNKCGAEMREPEDIPMEYFESGGR